MPSETSPLLSPVQRRMAGFALGAISIGVIFAVLYLATLALTRFLSYFSGVIWPLATAGIMALILRPIVAAIEKRWRLRRATAVLLLYCLFLLLAAALLLTFLPALIGQILDFALYLPTLWHNTMAWSERHFPEWLALIRRALENPTAKALLGGLGLQAQDLAAQLLPSLKAAGLEIIGLFGLAASVAVVPIYLFFFLLTDEDPTRDLGAHLPFLQPAQRDDAIFLIREFLGILVTFFRGQLLIGLLMGCLLALGFTLAGLKFGLALGLIFGLLNIIPYLGSILGLSVVLPLALFQNGGGFWLVGICLGVFALVQAVEGWFLTPRIMGRQTGLHPVAIIVAVFFWGQALGGIMGMMLAVPLTAFLVTAWRLIRKKYFQAVA